jgi:surface antigen
MHLLCSWKFNKIGKSWYNTRPGDGDAANWPAIAGDLGYATSFGSACQCDCILGSQRHMPYGHVAYVEAVNSDGTIDVSEYNWVKYSFSYREHVVYQSYGHATFIF